MKNIIVAKPNENPMVTWIKKRIEENLNFITLFSGSPGSGKSYNGLSLAEQINLNFNAETDITFNFKETLNLINKWFSESDSGIKQEYPRVILWDEPQIEISNRNWQSHMNRLVNYLLSTFRSQNIILIWAAPYMDFLDSQSMKLLHANFKCLGWDKKTKLSRVQPTLLQYNDFQKKYFNHKLFVCFREQTGSAMPMDYWDIPLASEKNRIIYERRKREFNIALNKEIEKDLDAMNKVKIKDEIEIKPLDTRKSLKKDEVNMAIACASGLNYRQSGEKFGKSPQMSWKFFRKLRKLGYQIEEFRNKPYWD